jgi:hypothetical protein
LIPRHAENVLKGIFSGAHAMSQRSKGIVVFFAPENDRAAQRLRMVAAQQMTGGSERKTPFVVCMQHRETGQRTHDSVQDFVIRICAPCQLRTICPPIADEIGDAELATA